MGCRCGPWKCLDSILLLVALLMTLIAATCYFTVFPRVFPDPERHGGKYPEYEETECRLHGRHGHHGHRHDEDSHEEEEHDVECSKNDKNEWCDADTWGNHRHKRSGGNWGWGRPRFPCIKVRVSFIFRGSQLTGILYQSWIEAENFERCSTSSCLADRGDNERHVRRWRHRLGERFPCYVNRHKTNDVVLQRDDMKCLAAKPGFHAVIWPGLLAGICFLWLLIRRCCCYSNMRNDPKIKPDAEGIYVPPPSQEGPLPDKKALEMGGEVILAPVVGPPPTYDGHYKDVDTLSMISAPPAYYDTTTEAEDSAVPKVDA